MKTCIQCGKPSIKITRGCCPKHYKETMAKVKRGKTTEEAEIAAGRLLPDNSLAKNDALYAKMNPGKVFKRRGKAAHSTPKRAPRVDEPAVAYTRLEGAYTFQACGGGRRVMRGGYHE